jgi:hypothetical protein
MVVVAYVSEILIITTTQWQCWLKLSTWLSTVYYI